MMTMSFNYTQHFNYALERQEDYLCIDMKSFYASVECVERGLDPLTTLLVVMSNSDSPVDSHWRHLPVPKGTRTNKRFTTL